MQGNVFVEYTGIGGMNMDAGIMPANVEGSTINGGQEGNTPLIFRVEWTLPGGMVNLGADYPDGPVWGYILGPADEGGKMYTDREFMIYLGTQGYQFDEEGNLIDTNQEAAVRNIVNDLCYKYVKRVMREAGMDPHADWEEMNSTFTPRGCFV